VGRHLKAGYKIATNDNSSNTLYTDIDPVTGGQGQQRPHQRLRAG
jgi:hypothetical protein